MNIDLGYLGKVVLHTIPPHEVREPFTETLFFTIVMDGCTNSGLRVCAVVDDREFAEGYYPMVWNNAILIKA